jgi:hypothetical protein
LRKVSALAGAGPTYQPRAINALHRLWPIDRKALLHQNGFPRQISLSKPPKHRISIPQGAADYRRNSHTFRPTSSQLPGPSIETAGTSQEEGNHTMNWIKTLFGTPEAPVVETPKPKRRTPRGPTKAELMEGNGRLRDRIALLETQVVELRRERAEPSGLRAALAAEANNANVASRRADVLEKQLAAANKRIAALMAPEMKLLMDSPENWPRLDH